MYMIRIAKNVAGWTAVASILLFPELTSAQSHSRAVIALVATMPSYASIKIPRAVARSSFSNSVSTLTLNDGEEGHVPISVSWSVGTSVQSVELTAFFATPSAALVSNSGAQIPSSRVLGSFSGGPLAPFSQTTRAGAPGALLLLRESIGPQSRTATRSGDLRIRLDLNSGSPLPAGEYQGFLNLRLDAY